MRRTIDRYANLAITVLIINIGALFLLRFRKILLIGKSMQRFNV